MKAKDSEVINSSVIHYNAVLITSYQLANLQVQELSEHQLLIDQLSNWLKTQIIGQDQLVNRLLIGLLGNGHLLVEGAPGLAKTRAVKVLAQALEGDFHRIQFTPDLLPSDITGTDVFRPEDGTFTFQKGPIFRNFLLADEINRSPAKVQAALLEAMAENQVSVGQKTYPLPDLFLVMATQNPIEQEGVYPLPEAQLDRFLMHVQVEYPDTEAEADILQMVRQENLNHAQEVPPIRLKQTDVFKIRDEILGLHMAPAVENYLIQLVMATRDAQMYGEDLANWLDFGASPRGTIALDRCARVRAWLEGRDFVTPEDVQDVYPDVLRHRIIPNFAAEAEGYTRDQILSELLARVPTV